MDSNKYELALLEGFAMATVFWFFFMLMAGVCVYDHGKHVGKMEAVASEAAAPERATEKEVGK